MNLDETNNSYMFIAESFITDSEEKIAPKTYGPFTMAGFARKPENMIEQDSS